MKILLIYPYFLEKRIHEEDIRAVPIGVYYIGAVLRAAGHDVDILNWHALDRSANEIRQTLQSAGADIIGFSVLNANRWGAIELARLAKQLDQKVTVVFGGVGATCLWQHLLTHFAAIDYIVVGEGEYPFLKLTRAIEAGDRGAIEKIGGVARRSGAGAVLTPAARSPEDLDALPDPAQYFRFQHLALTRGCPSNCNFCGSPSFWGRRVRFHSTAYFVAQLARQVARGVRFFYFCDDTFTLRRDRVLAICNAIIERGLDIAWTAISRVDHVDPELLYWMRRAGCIQISYGVESGSQRIRRKLNKRLNDDQIKRAFTDTIQTGILARAYFIYGCPTETWETIDETLALMDAIKPLSVIFYLLDLFPGTQMYRDYLSASGQNDDIWLQPMEGILYYQTDPELSQELVLAFGRKLRRTWRQRLPQYVDAINLSDRKSLFPLHADFYSRLAMTFDQGEYAQLDGVGDKQALAAKLYRRALRYAPDARAYLGLGIIAQKNGAYRDSIQILEKGLHHFKDHPQLNICLAVSLINIADFESALRHLQPFRHLPETAALINLCQQQHHPTT